MTILQNPIDLEELNSLAARSFGDLVKAVVDVDRGIIAIDAELHSDLEALLLADGSQQKSLWGVNFYPELEDEDFLEFDSMINVRPAHGNKTRSVDDTATRTQITELVNKWVLR